MTLWSSQFNYIYDGDNCDVILYSYYNFHTNSSSMHFFLLQIIPLFHNVVQGEKYIFSTSMS